MLVLYLGQEIDHVFMLFFLLSFTLLAVLPVFALLCSCCSFVSGTVSCGSSFWFAGYCRCLSS